MSRLLLLLLVASQLIDAERSQAHPHARNPSSQTLLSSSPPAVPLSFLKDEQERERESYLNWKTKEKERVRFALFASVVLRRVASHLSGARNRRRRRRPRGGRHGRFRRGTRPKGNLLYSFQQEPICRRLTDWSICVFFLLLLLRSKQKHLSRSSRLNCLIFCPIHHTHTHTNGTHGHGFA